MNILKLILSKLRNFKHFRSLAELCNLVNKFWIEALKTVFDAYGNLAAKPNNEETSGIYNLVQDLKGKYSPDIQKNGASYLVAELNGKNTTYNELTQSYLYIYAKPTTKIKKNWQWRIVIPSMGDCAVVNDE